MPTEPVDRLDLLDRLAEEFAIRFRSGERPSLTEYLERYPDLAEDLREMLPAMVTMEQIEKDLRNAEESSTGTPGRTAAPPLQQVGDYRILREIGRGGMGIVYEAEQISLGRRVAVKVLLSSPGSTGQSLERFRREARAAARLHHTNIVPVFEVGQVGAVSFYAMQFISGQGLDQVLDELRALRSGSPEAGPIAHSLKSGTFTVSRESQEVPARDINATVAASSTSTILPGQTDLSSVETARGTYFRSVAQIGLQVALGLDYAHQRGIVHRDIKPSNLLLDLAGVVWITDFGLAKSTDDALTHTGDIVGTLRYMAPERFLGQTDTRCDVYSLGLSLYELLVLRPAFEAPDRLRLIEMVRRQQIVPPRQFDRRVPRDLETIVLKAIHPDVNRRYPTASELAEDLRCFLNDQPIRARRASGTERLLRWARHNRGVASALAAIFVLLLAGLAGALYSNIQIGRARDDAVDARVVEAKARADANAGKQREEILRRHSEIRLYAARMGLAQHTWFDNDVRRTMHLLQECEPAPGEPDLRGWEWHYMNRLCHSEKLQLTGHDGPVFCVTFSPDGKLLASAGGGNLYFGNPGAKTRPGQVLIRDAVTGKLLHRLADFSDLVLRLAFTLDGARLVVVGRDGVKIFDTTSGQKLPCSIRHESPALASVAIDGAGERLLTGAGVGGGVGFGDSTVRLWDLKTGQELLRLSRTGEGVGHAVLSPGGQSIAVAWNGQDPAEKNHRVRLYDAGGTLCWTSAPIDAQVVRLAFSPDGRWLASAAIDGRARVLDALTGELTLKLTGFVGALRDVAFHPDGKHLVAVGDTPEVHTWDLDSGELMRTIRGPTKIVESVAFSPDGLSLATGDHAGQVKVWEAAGRQRGVLMKHGDYSARGALLFSPGGEKVMTVLRSKGRVDWCDLRTGETVRRAILPLSKTDDQRPVALSASGTRVACVHEEAPFAFEIWDVPSGKRVLRSTDGPGAIVAMIFSPDGRRLIASHAVRHGPSQPQSPQIRGAGRYSYVATVSDAESGVRLLTMDANEVFEHQANAEWENRASLAISPDGRVIAHAGFCGKVFLWDAECGQIVRTLGEPGEWHRSLTFSGDGKLLASQAYAKHVDVWTVADGSLRCRIALKAEECGLCLSPDGRRLASTDSSMWGTITLWETDGGTHVFELRGLAGSFGTSGMRALVAFDNTGWRLASLNNNNTTNIFDAMPLPEAVTTNQ